MMKKVFDALPGAFLAAGTGATLFGAIKDTLVLERVVKVLPWPWSLFWLIMLFVGAVCVVIGVSLRFRTGDTREPGRPQVIGQGLELFGGLSAGGMMFIYALILAAQFPFHEIWPSMSFMLALTAAFVGPAALIVRDLHRAHKAFPATVKTV